MRYGRNVSATSVEFGTTYSYINEYGTAIAHVKRVWQYDEPVSVQGMDRPGNTPAPEVLVVLAAANSLFEDASDVAQVGIDETKDEEDDNDCNVSRVCHQHYSTKREARGGRPHAHTVGIKMTDSGGLLFIDGLSIEVVIEASVASVGAGVAPSWVVVKTLPTEVKTSSDGDDDG